MHSEPKDEGANLRACLDACGISQQHYCDLIRALVEATSHDPAAHVVTRCDKEGYPIAIAGLLRVFDDITVIIEDRGASYAVWVKRTDAKGGTVKVLSFAEFPWHNFGAEQP